MVLKYPCTSESVFVVLFGFVSIYHVPTIFILKYSKTCLMLFRMLLSRSIFNARATCNNYKVSFSVGK